MKITQLLHKINLDLALESVQYSINDIYEIDYIQSLLKDYAKRYQVDEKSFVYGPKG